VAPGALHNLKALQRAKKKKLRFLYRSARRGLHAKVASAAMLVFYNKRRLHDLNY
jgi:hypothetical protein